MSNSSELLRNFDQFVIDQLKQAYSSKKTIEKLKGVSLYHEPFTHCVITDLVQDDKFVNDLNKEIKSKLKFQAKSNDLYKFSQTTDLAKNKLANLSVFRDKFLYGSFLEFLKKITGIELSSSKIDVTASKYEFSDYLLCHDDDIHDVNKHGRRIAFIYYLVPDDWSTDGSEGGNLDLFKVNEYLEPIDMTKSLTPKRNSLAFFEVSDRSYHQVSEVLAKSKTRLSIHGWFHGKINFRPSRHVEIVPELSLHSSIDPDLFFEWITEKYLKPTNQTDIQLKFSASSEIKLDKIFHQQKFEQVTEALSSQEIKWNKKGPANRRNYEIADLESAPQVIKDLIQVLSSEFMGLTLSNMTGLALHPSVPKSKVSEDGDEDEDDYEDDDDEEGEEDENDDSEEDDDEEEEEEDESDDSEDQAQENPNSNNLNNSNNKRSHEYFDDSDSDSEQQKSNGAHHNYYLDSVKGCTSSSITESENLYKKFKTSHHSEEKEDIQPSTSSQSEQILTPLNENLSDNEKPKCYFEIRRWKQGSYTLIRDDDSDIKTQALDLMIFFKSKLWSLDCGGNVSYIARDEDNELLTVSPEENCISLVYRDQETLKFTKYVNSRIRSINAEGCFYEICVVYYE